MDDAISDSLSPSPLPVRRGPAPIGVAPPQAARQPAPLTQQQKAAVIVQILLDGGQEVPISDLDPQDQAELTRMIAAMHYIDRDTLESVVREFITELENIGLSFPRGIDRTLGFIEGYISVQAADALRSDQSVAATSAVGNPWTRIATLDVGEIMALLEGESPTVAAIVASKLHTAKAAELLERTDGPRAREIALAIPVVAGTHPQTVERIGLTLAGRLDARPPTAFQGDPANRIGAILDRASSQTRETLLQDITADDPDFADRVRRTMFTFQDIPVRVEPRDVVKITRAVDETALITALTAAADSAPEASEFILANVSKRMAEQFNEAMGEHPPVKRREADAAMDQVMQAIRDLVSNGEMTLIPLEDDDA